MPLNYKTWEVLFVLTGLLAFLNTLLLFRRRLHREMPWFAVYLITVVVDQIIGWYVFTRYAYFVFFFVGWAFQGTIFLLGTMLIIEAMRNTLSEYPLVRRWGRNVLIATGILLIVVAAWSIPYGAEHATSYAKVALLAMRCIRLIQLGVIVVFFAFAKFLALRWQTYQVGILLGFGFYLAVSLSCSAVVAYGGNSVGFVSMVIESTGYLLTLLMWLVFIGRHEPRGTLPMPLSSSKDLDEWSNALTGLVKR